MALNDKKRVGSASRAAASDRPRRSPPVNGRATVATVAEHAQVSVQTVSNALNAPQRLRPETLKRVLDAVEKLNYRPSQAARALRTQATRSIGCRLLPPAQRGSGGILDRYLYALGTAAREADYGLLCHAATSDEDEVGIFDELVGRHAVDGVVITGTRYDDKRAAWLVERGIPSVSFGRPWGDETGRNTWVDVDGAAGIVTAVAHVADQGHTRIAFLGWPTFDAVGDDRLAGWTRAIKARRLPLRGLARHGDDSIPSGVALTEQFLDGTAAPTALICASDAMAIGAMRVLEDRGLRPGADVAVVGFDDSSGAELVRPGLTSLSQPLEDAAHAVIRLLLAQLGPRPTRPEHLLLEPTLVVRGSSLR